MIARYFCFLAIAFPLASIAFADEGVREFRPHLSDCAAFFGLLSQSNNSEQANQYKSMALVFSSYAVEVIPPNEIDKELDSSKKKISKLVSNARETDNREQLGTQLSLCISTLKDAEKTLRPKMSEFSQSMTPKLFE